MTGSDKKPPLRYSDHPNAPEWARDPALRNGSSTVTSFGEPIPEAKELPRKPKELQYSDHPNAPDWAKHPSQRKPVPPKAEPEPPPPPPGYVFPVEKFEAFLWRHANADLKVYGIFDGRQCESLHSRLIESDLRWTHLYQGDAAVLNVHHGPFLIAFEQGHELTRWLLKEGWGKGWGIWFTASTSIALELYRPLGGHIPGLRDKVEDKGGRAMFIPLKALTAEDSDPLILLRRHFRHFTKVEFEEDGRIVFFRYYDPLVLRRYLPTCSMAEYKGFFGPVSTFFCEGYHFVESLKCPQDCYRFSLVQSSETGELHYRGERFDLEANTVERIPQHEASKGKLERQMAFWIPIRVAQSEAMREQEEEYFVESVTADLADIITAAGHNPSLPGIKAMVIRQIAVGRKLGLRTERELLAFATCALVYGEGEDKSNPAGREILRLNEKDKGAYALSDHLNYFSKAGLSLQ